MSSLSLSGNVGGSGIWLGKKDVIGGRLDPEGDRSDWERAECGLGIFPRTLGLSEPFVPAWNVSTSDAGVRGAEYWVVGLPLISEKVELDCHGSGRSSRSEISTLRDCVDDLEDIDLVPAVSCPLLSLSRLDPGLPSHFELTFGTVSGIVADETPGMALGLSSPCSATSFFASCSSATLDGSLTKSPPSREGRFLFGGFKAVECRAVEALALAALAGRFADTVFGDLAGGFLVLVRGTTAVASSETECEEEFESS